MVSAPKLCCHILQTGSPKQIWTHKYANLGCKLPWYLMCFSGIQPVGWSGPPLAGCLFGAIQPVGWSGPTLAGCPLVIHICMYPHGTDICVCIHMVLIQEVHPTRSAASCTPANMTYWKLKSGPKPTCRTVIESYRNMFFYNIARNRFGKHWLIFTEIGAPEIHGETYLQDNYWFV